MRNVARLSKLTMKKTKFYVVWVGKKPGIYESWDDCLHHVKHYPGAKFKAYPSRHQAEMAFARGPEVQLPAVQPMAVQPPAVRLMAVQPPAVRAPSIRLAASPTNTILVTWDGPNGPVSDAIAVDAACNGSPGDLEYQGICLKTKKRLFHQGPFACGTNNIGEFLAIVHGLAIIDHHPQDSRIIYTDSAVAMGWVARKICKTTLAKNDVNAPLFTLIDRALKWLHDHPHHAIVHKWKTDQWGENPADFGRK